MLHIVVCEDHLTERENVVKIVKNVIMIDNMNAALVLETGDPQKVLSYMAETNKTGLYFLDIDLKSDMNGIELAEQIRNYDPRGFIVIVTAHPDELPLVFAYKIEAMDFINKSSYYDIRERIETCVRLSYARYTAHTDIPYPYLMIKKDDEMSAIAFENIISIETSPQRNDKILILQTEDDKRILFPETLRNMEKRLDNRFNRINQSCILNLTKVNSFLLSERKITMSNGAVFFIPANKIKEAKKHLSQFNFFIK